MTLKQIINLSASIIIAVMTAVIIILSCTIASQYKEIGKLKAEANFYRQTVKDLKEEAIQQAAIYAKKDELLDEVRRCRTLKDYLAVWAKINEELDK